jgi:hypothetical protein
LRRGIGFSTRGIFNDGSEAEVVWCGSMAGPHGVRGELPTYDRGSCFYMIAWTRDERTKDPDERRSYYNPNRGRALARWREQRRRAAMNATAGATTAQAA